MTGAVISNDLIGGAPHQTLLKFFLPDMSTSPYARSLGSTFKFWFRTLSISHIYRHRYILAIIALRFAYHGIVWPFLSCFLQQITMPKERRCATQPFNAALMTRLGLAHGKPTSQLPCRFNSRQLLSEL